MKIAKHKNDVNKNVIEGTYFRLHICGRVADNEGLSFCYERTCRQQQLTKSVTRAHRAAVRNWFTCRRGPSSGSRPGSTDRSVTAAISSRSSSTVKATSRSWWRTCAA